MNLTDNRMDQVPPSYFQAIGLLTDHQSAQPQPTHVNPAYSQEILDLDHFLGSVKFSNNYLITKNNLFLHSCLFYGVTYELITNKCISTGFLSCCFIPFCIDGKISETNLQY